MELSSPEVGRCLGSCCSKSEGRAEEAEHRNCTNVSKEANKCVCGMGGLGVVIEEYIEGSAK